MQAARPAGAHKQHVAITEQLLCALLAQNGARVDFRADAKRHAGREVGFDNAGNHVYGRTLGGHNHVNAGRPRHLGQSLHAAFNIFAGDHHQIGHFVDDDDDIRHGLKLERLCLIDRLAGFFVIAGHDCTGRGLAGGFKLGDFFIVAGHAPHAERGHRAVARFHFAHGPFQRDNRFFRIRHHRGEQMRRAVIDRQLEHFRVNHDELTLLRRQRVHDRQDHGVNADGLTRAGGTRDEQMRHLGQISDKWLPANIFAHRHRQPGLGIFERARVQHITQPDGLAAAIGQLDTDGVTPRHDGNPRALGGHGPGDIIGQIDDARRLHARRRLKFIKRDHRARAHLADLAFDAKV